jgi:hypothetical protein
VKEDAKKNKNERSAEQVSAADALKSMKGFKQRKEKFIAAIRKGQD